MPAARLIAFYLPQFHPTPENDAWWGKGFTEWTNVAKARPLFPGHVQPQLPADLGFYDLRVPEVREAQAALAREAGIEGFCYWHYWFAGRRILDRPFREVIASGAPDFPFCVGWANHTWSSHWYGADRRVLIEQTYPGRDDHERHFHALLPAFLDRRYVRVNGRPLFVVFRPKDLPDPDRAIALWQDLAVRNGLPGVHFVAHLFDGEFDYPWRSVGYAGAVVTNEHKVFRHRTSHIASKRLGSARLASARARSLRPYFSELGEIGRLLGHRALGRLLGWPPGVHSYKDALLFLRSDRAVQSGCYPSVVPRWDNTPRAGPKGIVLHGSTPELFREHLEETLASVASRPAEDRIVFVKSWNEWAEGNYLEPDARFGRRYLDVVRSVLNQASDLAGLGLPTTASP